MIKKFFLILIAISLFIYTYGEKVKYSNEFLAIGVGARALGMSNANVALVNDVTSGYWNPAGITNTPSTIQIGLMHAEYFMGIGKYDYGAFATKIDATSTVGLSVLRFGIDDIPDTSELIDVNGNINYSKIKSFSSANYGFLFTYGRKTKIEGLKYGTNFKIIYNKVGDFAKSYGFGFDFGLQYNYKKWFLGFMGRDITSTFNAWSYTLSDNMKAVFTQTNNIIPTNTLEITLPKFIIGGGRTFIIKKNFTTTFELDLDLNTDGKRNVMLKTDFMSVEPHLGIELGYKDIIFVRGGIGNIQQETNDDNKIITTFQPNFGIGVKIKDLLTIDYAFTDIGDQSIAPLSNIFSLKLNINKKGNN